MYIAQHASTRFAAVSSPSIHPTIHPVDNSVRHQIINMPPKKAAAAAGTTASKKANPPAHPSYKGMLLHHNHDRALALVSSRSPINAHSICIDMIKEAIINVSTTRLRQDKCSSTPGASATDGQGSPLVYTRLPRDNHREEACKSTNVSIVTAQGTQWL